MKYSPVNNWNQLYKRFDAPISTLDCGELCAPGNNGTPACCDHRINVPVLFADELAWQRTRGCGMWRKRPARTAIEKKEGGEIDDYIVYGRCTGIKNCNRSMRSLSCRFFPFEPYIDSRGKFTGLVFMRSAYKSCPFAADPSSIVNPAYLWQAMHIWTTIFQLYPQELDLYTCESRKLRAYYSRKKRRLRIFKPVLPHT